MSDGLELLIAPPDDAQIPTPDDIPEPIATDMPTADDTDIPTLDRGGIDAIRQLLTLEGQFVHNLRCGPDGPPDAWLWTDEEIEALVPLVQMGAERYGVAGVVNANAPMIRAAGAITGHVTRSLIAERRWRQANETAPVPEPTDGFDLTSYAGDDGIDTDGPSPAAQSGTGIGRTGVDQLAGALRGER